MAEKQITDCYYFMAKKCMWGDACQFRHSFAAKNNPTVCRYWQQKRCTRPDCPFRHPNKNDDYDYTRDHSPGSPPESSSPSSYPPGVPRAHIHCEMCDIYCPSQKHYQEHINGKRHIETEAAMKYAQRKKNRVLENDSPRGQLYSPGKEDVSNRLRVSTTVNNTNDARRCSLCNIDINAWSGEDSASHFFSKQHKNQFMKAVVRTLQEMIPDKNLGEEYTLVTMKILDRVMVVGSPLAEKWECELFAGINENFVISVAEKTIFKKLEQSFSTAISSENGKFGITDTHGNSIEVIALPDSFVPNDLQSSLIEPQVYFEGHTPKPAAASVKQETESKDYASRFLDEVLTETLTPSSRLLEQSANAPSDRASAVRNTEVPPPPSVASPARSDSRKRPFESDDSERAKKRDRREDSLSSSKEASPERSAERAKKSKKNSRDDLARDVKRLRESIDDLLKAQGEMKFDIEQLISKRRREEKEPPGSCCKACVTQDDLKGFVRALKEEFKSSLHALHAELDGNTKSTAHKDDLISRLRKDIENLREEKYQQEEKLKKDVSYYKNKCIELESSRGTKSNDKRDADSSVDKRGRLMNNRGRDNRDTKDNRNTSRGRETNSYRDSIHDSHNNSLSSSYNSINNALSSSNNSINNALSSSNNSINNDSTTSTEKPTPVVNDYDYVIETRESGVAARKESFLEFL